MNWKRLSNPEILKELGLRVRNRRIHKKLTQEDLSQSSGININTVRNMEYGEPVTTESFIKVLRALKLLDQLEEFLPDIGPSPIDLMRNQGKQIQRVRKPIQ